MGIVCLDLEGVLVPDIWIAFAEATGIPDFRRTMRDEPDYDKLMRRRLGLLRRHGLRLADIQRAIAAGDSYNDTAMLGAADAGFFIHPPDGIAARFPQFKEHRDYAGLRARIDSAAA